jgi:predicted outer membrane protein
MKKAAWILLLLLASCGNNNQSTADADEPDDFPPYDQYGNY